MPSHALRIGIEQATEADAAEIAALRNAAADHLTEEHGAGHWSSLCTERSVTLDMRHARLLVARSRSRIVGTLRLATKKPWAIDVRYFTPVPRPLYLLDMVVAPKRQGRGIGRKLLVVAVLTAREWPAQAIRLDAYNTTAGAGEFYLKCGYNEVGQVDYRGTPLRYFELILA